ncbi:MAG: LysR family transcriptional regulator [Thioalkalivibrionaceae bacterium]
MAKTTLDQWRMFRAVARAGSFATAAQRVHKSTSTVHHAVTMLRDRLGVELFETGGRGLQLTRSGRALLRRAEILLEEAQAIERVAGALRDGVEAELRVGVDQLVPPEALHPVLARFASQFPQTQLVWVDVLLTGGPEAFEERRVDVLIGTHVPSTARGGVFGSIRMRPVVSPGHRLAQLAAVNLRTLHGERQIVIRDSAEQGNADGGWLAANARWSVGHVADARARVLEGFGFAWLPEWLVGDDLASGRLIELRVMNAGDGPVAGLSGPLASSPESGIGAVPEPAQESALADASLELACDEDGAFERVELHWAACAEADLGPAGMAFVQALAVRAREWSRRAV